MPVRRPSTLAETRCNKNDIPMVLRGTKSRLHGCSILFVCIETDLKNRENGPEKIVTFLIPARRKNTLRSAKTLNQNFGPLKKTMSWLSK